MGCHFRGIAVLLCFLSLAPYINGQEPKSSFLWLSDIHLEPDYGTSKAATKHNQACTLESAKESFPYGQFGCDAPTLLVEQTLDYAQAIANTTNIDFIIASGDFSRHGNEYLENPLQLTREILETVMDMIATRFPGVPVLVAVGNDDFTPDYYIDIEETTENNTMLELVTGAFNYSFQTEEEVSSFRSGARFARNISDLLTILSINTVVYSVEHSPDQESIEDPFGQFEWLRNQLEVAKSTRRNVWIVGHIAPTIGSYGHDNLWHTSYVDRYFDVIQDYFPTTICGQLFGHLHTDEFRLAHYGSEGLAGVLMGKQYPLYIASSFTSIYGSNPSFRVVQYETETGNLLDYDTYFFNQSTTQVPPDWIKAPSFRESFNIPDMSASSLELILNRLADKVPEENHSIWDTFIARQSIYAPPEMGPCTDRICRKEWVCTLSSISEDQYQECVVQTWSPWRHSTTSGPLAILAASLATGIVLVGAIWKIRRCILVRRNYELHYDDDEHLQDEDANFEHHRHDHSQEKESDDFIDVPEIT